MKYVIDRFEGDYAVCENDDLKRINVEKSRLPRGVKEGSTIEIDEAGEIALIDDAERVKRIADKMKSVWR